MSTLPQSSLIKGEYDVWLFLSAYAKDHACVPELLWRKQLIVALRRAGTGFAHGAPWFVSDEPVIEN
jgi:hypothetical protein